MKKIFLCLCLLIPLTGFAQKGKGGSPTSTGPTRFWTCTLPGGIYTVSLSAITSVSTHDYIVDGAVAVTELTIGTSGQVEGRFYFVDKVSTNMPIGQTAADKVQEHMQNGIDKVTGGSASDFLLNKVMKNYPTTTHAHTVEYRLQTKDDVTKLFKSVQAALLANEDGTIKIGETTSN
jgi:hypothetical protein